MEPKIEQLLNEVESELKLLFRNKLSEIILYGSYARGDQNNKSDIDVIALVDEIDLNQYDRQILGLNVDLSIDYDVDLSIVIISRVDFDSNVDIIPLYRNIEKEGISIYAA
jgi:predicted nucleotidyltransferase